MIYHHSYVVSHEWGKEHLDLFHSLAGGNGIRFIATQYMAKDFKFKEDGLDHLGQKKFRIDLVVFDREKWSEFLKRMRNLIEDDARLFEDVKEIIHKLENNE